jgi:hypothetical protein
MPRVAVVQCPVPAGPPAGRQLSEGRAPSSIDESPLVGPAGAAVGTTPAVSPTPTNVPTPMLDVAIQQLHRQLRAQRQQQRDAVVAPSTRQGASVSSAQASPSPAHDLADRALFGSLALPQRQALGRARPFGVALTFSANTPLLPFPPLPPPTPPALPHNVTARPVTSPDAAAFFRFDSVGALRGPRGAFPGAVVASPGHNDASRSSASTHFARRLATTDSARNLSVLASSPLSPLAAQRGGVTDIARRSIGGAAFGGADVASAAAATAAAFPRIDSVMRSLSPSPTDPAFVYPPPPFAQARAAAATAATTAAPAEHVSSSSSSFASSRSCSPVAARDALLLAAAATATSPVVRSARVLVVATPEPAPSFAALPVPSWADHAATASSSVAQPPPPLPAAMLPAPAAAPGAGAGGAAAVAHAVLSSPPPARTASEYLRGCALDRVAAIEAALSDVTGLGFVFASLIDDDDGNARNGGNGSAPPAPQPGVGNARTVEAALECHTVVSDFRGCQRDAAVTLGMAFPPLFPLAPPTLTLIGIGVASRARARFGASAFVPLSPAGPEASRALAGAGDAASGSALFPVSGGGAVAASPVAAAPPATCTLSHISVVSRTALTAASCCDVLAASNAAAPAAAAAPTDASAAAVVAATSPRFAGARSLVDDPGAAAAMTEAARTALAAFARVRCDAQRNPGCGFFERDTAAALIVDAVAAVRAGVLAFVQQQLLLRRASLATVVSSASQCMPVDRTAPSPARTATAAVAAAGATGAGGDRPPVPQQRGRGRPRATSGRDSPLVLVVG